jgi:hypothetical protein
MGQSSDQPGGKLAVRLIVTSFIKFVSILAPQLEAGLDGDQPQFLTLLVATAHTISLLTPEWKASTVRLDPSFFGNTCVDPDSTHPWSNSLKSSQAIFFATFSDHKKSFQFKVEKRCQWLRCQSNILEKGPAP